MSDIIIRDNALLPPFIIRRSGCAGHFIFLNDNLCSGMAFTSARQKAFYSDVDKIGKC